MKKIVLFLILLTILPVSICRAGFLGIKKPSETIAFPVHPPLDSAGIPGTPDSIQVITYADNDNSAAYTATAVGYALAQIDTTKEFGGTHIWFVDQIQDLDGDGGNVELAIQVVAWYKKLPTYTFASVQVISDSLNMVSTFDPANDTVTADMIRISGDAIAANNFETMLDGSGGAQLSLGRLYIDSAVNGGILEIRNTGNGLLSSGVFIQGGTFVGHGIHVEARGSGHGIFFEGSGEGAGIMAAGGGGTFNDIVGDIEGAIDSIGAGGIDAVWNEILADHTVAGSVGDVLLDSIDAMVSSAGGTAEISDADMAAIADSVWDESKANHNLTGSFGNYLDAPISAVRTGNGAYSISLTIFDSANTQVVPNVKLSVYSLAMNAMLAVGTSNSSGSLAFNLDTGSYIISATAPGYIFSAYDTLLISGVAADTVSGYRFDPGSPASEDQCRVYGFIYGVDGQAIEGISVSAQLTGGMARRGTTIVSPYKYSTETDSTGYFYLDLIPSNDLNPSGTKYLITATYPAGTVLKKRVEVPDNSSWQLSW